jgi:two-component system alkaline phosphatase synthesis response regulator PhoP
MDRIVENIVNGISKTEQESFTKDEIVNLIKDLTVENRLPIVESNGVIVDTEKFLVKINDVEHHLPKKVFNLLHYLISNKNKSISRDDLMQNVWEDDVIVGGRTVDVHIRKLRSLLPADYIKTSFGMGYTWVEN